MRKSTEKAIKKEWSTKMWPDLMRGLRTMTKEIENITTGENFTFITDKADNIRKWVELEKRVMRSNSLHGNSGRSRL